METYGTGSGARWMTSRQIREMKRNMQKVPRIQKKSDEYHRQEEESAEKILDQVAQIPDTATMIQSERPDTTMKMSLTNLRQKIRFIFTKQ